MASGLSLIVSDSWLSSQSKTFRSYLQLALIVTAAGAIYPLLYLRQNFELTMLEAFDISQAQLRYCSSMLGLIFIMTYIPSGWLADRFSSRKLMAFSLLATAFLGLWFSTMPSYHSLLVIYGGWGLATGLTFWSAHMKLVAMLAKKDQQGRFFGILEGGRGLVEALLATVAIALFAYVLSQEYGSIKIALKQVIYFYVGVLLVISPLIYWLLEDFVDADFAANNGDKKSFRNDLMAVLTRRDIWLCTACIVCGYQLFYATYSFSAYLQKTSGLGAVMVGTIMVTKLWMRPIGAIAAGFVGDLISPSKVLSILLVLASGSLAMMAFLPAMTAPVILLAIVLLVGLLTYAVRGLYWATLGECNVPNRIKGLAIGVVSIIGYSPEVYLPLLSASLIEQYPNGLGYRIYYLIISLCGVLGARAAYVLARHKN